MSEPFIAEIRIFASNFAPRDWAFCDGTLLPISQNTALFSLIGTTYGGDGRTTTALPDLRGRAPMHSGNGPALTSRRLGQRGGTVTETLSEAQMPSHDHALNGFNSAEQANPAGDKGLGAAAMYRTGATAAAPLADEALAPTGGVSGGGAGAHENRQPLLGINFIIALQGQFPSRS